MILRDMKKKSFYISLDYESEFMRSDVAVKTYVLPDGQVFLFSAATTSLLIQVSNFNCSVLI